MFKRILVAVDGSPASNAGLKSAIHLAKEKAATLVVLHVLEDSLAPVIYLPVFLMDTYLSMIQESGEIILAKAVSLARHSGVTVEPAMARAGMRTVARTVTDLATKANADLIVLGTHGRRGLRRVLMGSDAEAVVRKTTVPVLLVRDASVRVRRNRIPQAGRAR